MIFAAVISAEAGLDVPRRFQWRWLSRVGGVLAEAGLDVLRRLSLVCGLALDRSEMAYVFPANLLARTGQNVIFEYIIVYYTGIRLHSRLGDQSPTAFEAKYPPR